jgi:ribosomal-protein-alanine N-acetyltransferase
MANNPPLIFPTLHTQRLTLRQLTAEDAAALLDIFGDERVARFLDGPTLTSLSETLEIVAWADEIFAQQRGLRWGITLRDGNQVIGTCGYHLWSPVDARAEIGFDLAPAYWRQGIMSEALQSVLAYGFEQMQLNRIQAHALPGNAASLGLLTRLGFQHEGLLRQYRFYRGRYNDEALLSLLRDDYLPEQRFS